MDKDFISSFNQNKEYIAKKSPLTEQMQNLDSEKRRMIQIYDAQISKLMQEIAEMPEPKCNHDICLHYKVNDDYMGEGYACPCCGNLLMIKDEQAKIIEVNHEMTMSELQQLLTNLRNMIDSTLSNTPDISLDDLTEILESYINQNRGVSKLS